MAADFRSSNSTTYASRTNTTITAPSGIVNGDVLLLYWLVGVAGARPSPTPPSGFAAVTGSYPFTINDGSFFVDCFIWYKIAASEAGDYTVTHGTGTSQGFCSANSGGLNAQPVATTNSGTGTTSTALSVTPVADQSLVTFIQTDWGSTANNLTAPTGSTPTFTERMDTAPLSFVATGVLSPAGATGNKSMTNNCAVGNPWAAFMVVIEAAGAAAADLSYARSGKRPRPYAPGLAR